MKKLTPEEMKEHLKIEFSKTTEVENVSIEEIEKLFGFDKIKPILVTSSTFNEEFDDDFRELYEQTLREFFNKTQEKLKASSAYDFLFEDKNNEYDEEYKDYIKEDK